MEINIISMSGAELKHLYDISGLKGVDFAKRLGISRPTLYLLFKEKIVEESIQEIIDNDPLLSEKRQLFNKPQSESQEIQKYEPSDSVWERAIAAITESIQNTAKVIQQNTEILNVVKDDNKFIKEDALLFRQMIENIMQTNNLATQSKSKSI